MIMTFEEYDKLIESFRDIDTPTFWPSLEQIMLFEEDPGKWMKFVLYLMEKGKRPKDREERYRKRLLNLFLRENLELVNATQEA